MPFFEEFTDLMPYEDIILHQHSTYSQGGDLLPGDDLIVQGYIHGKSTKVVNSDGIEVNSKAQVYLATIVEINPDTKVTLPTGFNPRSNLPILTVDRLSDEDGVAAMVLYL